MATDNGFVAVSAAGALLLLAPACKSSEPASASREPASATVEASATPKAHADSEPAEPSATHHESPRAEELVQIELGLVDDATREALAARLGDDSPLADAEALLAVSYTIADHWHIYWRNPGESGLRTRITVEAEDARAGETLYPAPERLVAQGGQVTYGWGEAAVLFVPLAALDDAPALTIETRYLVCRESCIPGKVALEAKLAELPARTDATTQAMLARVPEPAGDRVSTRWADGELSVRPSPGGSLTQLFPYASDDAVLASQDHDGDALVLRYRLSQAPPADLAQGVLEAQFDGEPVWLELASAWPAT